MLKAKSLFMLLLMLFVAACGSGSNNVNNNVSSSTNNLNFKQLITNNDYAITEDKYDPDIAIAACKGSPANGNLWQYDKDYPFPSPEPTPEDCGEYSTQLSYGCKNANNTHNRIKLSVGAIVPAGSITPTCTLSVIDHKWALTAAHCVIDIDTHKFLDWVINDNFYLMFNTSSGGRIYTHATAIYVPKHLQWTNDIALIELRDSLPEDNVPLPIAANDYIPESSQLMWVAGYGRLENNTENTDMKFSYRRTYFKTLDVDYLLTTGTLPVLYKNELSAWKLTGPGDSGGPVLLEDPICKKLSIVGVASRVPCSYSSYFAKVGAATTNNIAVFKNKSWIEKVIKGGDHIDNYAQCYSKNNICNTKKLYVINYTSNMISIVEPAQNYKVSSMVATGVEPVKLVFSPDNRYAYVLNSMNSSIFAYNVLPSGQLIARSEFNIYNVTDYQYPSDMVIAKIASSRFIYVSSDKENRIYILKQNIDGSLTKSVWQNLVNANNQAINPQSIIFFNDWVAILASDGVYAYDIDKPSGLLINVRKLISIDQLKNKAIKLVAIDKQSQFCVLTREYLSCNYAKDLNGERRILFNAKYDFPDKILTDGDIIQTKGIREADDFFSYGDYVYVSDNNSKLISIFQIKTSKKKQLIKIELNHKIESPYEPYRMFIANNNLFFTIPELSRVAIYKNINDFSGVFSSGGYSPTIITSLNNDED